MITDPVCLLVSMVAIRCIFCRLATRGVEILLGKLAVGGTTQTKTKTDIPTENAYNSIVFLEKQVCEHVS